MLGFFPLWFLNLPVSTLSSIQHQTNLFIIFQYICKNISKINQTHGQQRNYKNAIKI